KSTLPAVLLSIKYAELRRPLSDDDMIYVFPSDHMIEPLLAFKSAIKKAAQLAGDGKMVVFGVKPDHPKEGYGYIIKSKRYKSGFLVNRFVEKPSGKAAGELIKKGAFWNAGIFCFTKGAFLRELARFQPKIAVYSESGYNTLHKKFKSIKAISMDYGIMQYTKNAGVVEFRLKWSDLGSWDSFLQYFTRKKGNFNIGKAEFLETNNSFTYSVNRLMCLVGLNDVIAIDSPDSLLLVKKGYSDHVKDLVALMDKKGYTHSKDGATVYRPWGYYTVLHEAKGYKVKEIGVYPKKTIALQSHKHRSEHWNVVEGEARLSVAGKSSRARRNESIYVPRGIKHTVYNPTNKITKIIEVQIGCYLGEDDIKRFMRY
ncbi:MAG: cupin domain-containing protein, partial [Candidatus Omnitrophica bacterium]|nr:cupin domain-containing protein [Candidatus Omnitrophota bacterium]